MKPVTCPLCGLSDFEGATDKSDALGAMTAWTDAFLRRCQHVQERRHHSDLKSHTCPHWARAMEQAAKQNASDLIGG